MVLTRDKIEEIECMTWDILVDAYGKEDVVPPIQLNLIIEFAGLTLKQGRFQEEDVSGAYDKSNKTIYIKENDSYARKAFTVAHELGHFYLHDSKPYETFFRYDIDRIEKEERILEQEANCFAASLLMPKPVITVLWRAIGDINEIAKRCDVSSTAAHYRLKNLGLLDHYE